MGGAHRRKMGEGGAKSRLRYPLHLEELSTLALVRRSKLRRGGTKPGEAKDRSPASQMFVGVRLCATEERSSKDLPVES